MRILVALFLLLATACASAPPAAAPAPEPPVAATPVPDPALTPPAPGFETLAAELTGMVKADQEVRRRWLKEQNSPAIKEEMRQLGVAHVARLEQILAEHGWPGRTRVGFNATGAAWTIAQHGGPEFLQRVLPLMYEAVRNRELDEALYGTSLDRVLVQRGEKQLYGTQFDVDIATGKCEPQPIEDPEHVDERRLRAGMTSLKEYTDQLCALYLQTQK